MQDFVLKKACIKSELCHLVLLGYCGDASKTTETSEGKKTAVSRPWACEFESADAQCLHHLSCSEQSKRGYSVLNEAPAVGSMKVK